MSKDKKPVLVIIGGGFGGIELIKKLRDSPFDIILIDKNNHHTDALNIRSLLLREFEMAITRIQSDEKKILLNFVIIGGGSTGIEIAGAMAVFTTHIVASDYPELDPGLMNIHLIEAADRILPMMSENSSSKAYRYLTHMGVKVWLNTRVSNYDGLNVTFSDGTILRSSAFIWTAGVKGAIIPGINPDSVIGNRYIVNGFNQVKDYDNIFSIGDVAVMVSPANPNGHPLLAMPAIQQGKRLAGNLKLHLAGRAMKKFTYTDLGVLATIGRNKAVAELPFGMFSGFFAWFLWMFIHLIRLIGFRNRIIILIEWMFSYFTYEYSFRIITQNGKQTLNTRGGKMRKK